MFAICRGLSQTHTRTLTHSHACVCVCVNIARLGRLEQGGNGVAGVLANCCNARGNIAVIVCTCQRGFPFSIFHSTCRRSAFLQLVRWFFF